MNTRTNAMCKPTREALSDYLEGGLPPPERQALAEHLATCAECAREEREMNSLLSVLHDRLPRQEPVLDLWAEFAPKLEQFHAEERLGVWAKFRLRLSRFAGNVAFGAILFTQAVALNTQSRMQKYLLADPFRSSEESA